MTLREHPALIEAHRGDSANAPENTLAAFRRALALGVPWIELDVRLSRDGHLMVIHDDTVDRTTSGSGAVGKMTAEELQRLDAGAWFAPEFAKERLPRFAEVLELVAPTDTLLNVEIKVSAAGVELPRAVVELLGRFRKEAQYVVSSFDLEALLQVRALAPEISLALIGAGPEILPLAVGRGFPWIHAAYHSLAPELVAEAHANGIRVNVWTVDDPAHASACRMRGVDKICTNNPALMMATAH